MDVGIEPFWWPGKHVAEVLDYSTDWTTWLNGDTIVSSTWTITPIGQTAGSGDAVLNVANPPIAGGLVTVWVSQGLAGRLYSLVNSISTVGSGGTSRVGVRLGLLKVVS